MIRFAKLALLLALIVWSMGTAVADTWDLAADFSTTSPTFHDWSMGYRTLATGAFTTYGQPYTALIAGGLGVWWDGDWPHGAVCYNVSSTEASYLDPLAAGMHTGSDPAYEPAIRWTSPSDQVVYVDTFFTGQSAEPTTCTCRVLRNGALKFSAPITGCYGLWPDREYASGDPKSQTFQKYIWVPAGTTIDFAEAPLGKWSGNVLGVKTTITTAMGYAMIQGVVQSAATGAPLAGVTVQSASGGYVDVTAADGSYLMAVPASQTYSLTASVAGYYDLTISVASGAENTITTQDFALVSGKITGFVLEAGGTPIANAKVQVIGGVSTMTAADGSYTLYVTAGIYDVKASHGGYTSQQASVDASSGTATQTFNLARLSNFSYAGDFSVTDNPNGVWTYGYRHLWGDFVPFTSTYTYAEYNNLMFWDVDGSLGSGSCWHYPGPDILVLGSQSWNADIGYILPASGGTPYKVTAQFTVPYDATFVVDAQFTGQDNATTGVYVRRNSVTLASGYINGNIGWPPDYAARYGTYEFGYSTVVAATEGETIEFVVDAGGNGWSNDLTGLAATVNVLSGSKSAIVGAVKANNTGFPPVANATVKILQTGAQTLTGPGGIYGLEVDPGTYTVQVSQAGYQTQTQTVTVSAGETKIADFTMEYLPGQTYHVKPGGDDTKDGLTLATAWATIGNGDAKGVLVPGSTVIVHEGSYGVQTGGAVCGLANCPGKSGSPITYKAEGKVVLALSPDITGTAYIGFNLQGALLHDIVIDGFEVQGGPWGVRANCGGNVTVKNCYFHDMGSVTDAFPSAAGVYVTCDNNIVENCRFANIRLENWSGPGLYGACAIYTANCSGNTYRNNDCYVLGGDPEKSDTGYMIRVRNSANTKIQNNTFCSAGCGIRVWEGSTQTQVTNNIIANMLEYGIINSDSAGTVANSYNLYNNLGLGNYSGGVSTGTGEISDQDPLFMNEPFHNHHLLAASPAMNHGTNIGLPFIGSAPDMGAYESDGSGPVTVADLGELKNLPAFTSVQVSGKIATADAGSMPNFVGDAFYDFIGGTYYNYNMTYIEEPTRYAGIKVLMPADMFLWTGETATLIGDVGLDSNGEKTLRISEMSNIIQGTAPSALGVPAKSFFDAGASVTGLAVKVWGKVTYINLDPMTGPMAVYVDDGSGKDDGTGVAIGVRGIPSYDWGDLGLTLVDDYVSIAGIASHDYVDGKIVPVIRMRTGDDSRNFSIVP